MHTSSKSVAASSQTRSSHAVVRAVLSFVCAVAIGGFAVVSFADDIAPCQPDPDTAEKDKGPAGETSDCSYSPITDKPQPPSSGIPKNLNCPAGCDNKGSGFDAGDGVYIPPPQDFDLPSPFQPAVFCGLQVRGDAFCSISHLRPSIGVPWPGLSDCDLVEGVGNLGNAGSDGLRPELQRFSASNYQKDYITMSTPQGGYKTFRRYPAVASGITGGKYKNSPSDSVHSILFVGVNGESGVLLAKPRETSPEEIPPLVEYYGTDGTKMTFFGFYDDEDQPDPFVTLTFMNRLATGQLWKMERPKGTGGSDVLYVGDVDDPLAAAGEGFDAIITGFGSNGYYGQAQILTRVNAVSQLGGNKYVYEYGGRAPYRLKKITIQTQETEPVVLRTVDLNYYEDQVSTWPPISETFADFPDGCGGHGDLRLVTVTTPMEGRDLVEYTYYRYYTGYEPSTGAIPPYPGGASAPCHQMKAIVAPEGMRRLLLEQEHGIAELEDIHDDELINYASTWLQYEVSAWINTTTSEIVYEAPEELGYDIKTGTRVLQQTGCGCSGEASRAWQFFYESGNPSKLNDGEPVFFANGFQWTRLGDESAPFAKDVYDTLQSYEVRADGTFHTRLFDGYRQQVGEYLSDTYGTYETDWSAARWQASLIDRDVRGRISATFSSSAIDPETFNPEGGDIRVLTDTGLVRHVGYMTTYPTGTSSGDVEERATKSAADLLAGAPTQQRTSIGAAGDQIVQSQAAYKSGSVWSVNVLLPPASADWSGDRVRAPFALPLETESYKTDSTSGASEDTSYSYSTWSAGTDPGYLLKSVAVSRLVPSSENGSDTAVVSTEYRYQDGRTAFRRSEDGRWSYFEYNYAGQLTRSIQDVKSSSGDTPMGSTVTAFDITPDFPSDGQHLVHEYEYDSAGRLIKHQLPPTQTVTNRSERFYHFTAPDGRKTVITVPMVIDTGSEVRYFGPASYRVENLAGKVEVDAELAITGDSNGAGGNHPYSTTAPASWLDVEGENVVTAVQAPASLSRLRVSIYNRSGSQLKQSRVYHDIPTSDATDWGSGGTGSWTYVTASSAEVATYEYDALGRLARVADRAGTGHETLTRTVFDFRGLPVERWIGTDDAADTAVGSGGWPIGNGRTTAPGSPAGGFDMTKVAAIEYVPGEGAMDGWLTKRTEDADGNWATTGDQRVTEYLRDYRGRVIVEKRTDAPTVVRKYDNLGRVIAQGTFVRGTSAVDSPSDIEAVDPTSISTGRQSLIESFYDGRGQVWKTVTHRIDQSDGSIMTDSSNALSTLFRYDPTGRMIKTTGTSLSKIRYDGLGRTLRRWTLAADGTGLSSGHMSDYADDYGDYDPGTEEGEVAIGTIVAGDVVLELQQSVYESATGNLLGRIQISRSQAEPLAWDDDELGTMGDLHTDIAIFPESVLAGNVKGRLQLTTYFYDDLNRLETTAFRGNAGFTDYKPDPSGAASTGTAPAIPGTKPTASTADVLWTKNEYNPKGELELATDPDGKKTKTEYTWDGRVKKTTRNYVNGTAGGGTHDDEDQIVEYAYTNGLLTSMTATNPSSQTSGSNGTAAGSQVTTYVYGTTKGSTPGSGSPPASQIATGNLLLKTVYPEGTTSTAEADRTVFVAYNALGEAAWSKDQLGNEIETTRDKAGRVTATTAAIATAATDSDDGRTSTDNSVGSIHLAYDSRGMVSTVWQNDTTHGAVGEALDQVTYFYDDYGMLTKILQKVDGDSTSDTDGYVVTYTNGRAAPVKTSSAFVGRQGVRRTGMGLPGAGASNAITFNYGMPENLNDLVGRVESVDMAGSGTIATATYTYLGASQLVGTTLEETDFTNRLFGTGPSETDTYKLTAAGAGMDKFGRVIESRWGRPGLGGASENEGYAYWASVSYGYAGDIVSSADRLMPGHDVVYTNDGLHRLAAAQEGTLSTGSISNQTFKQSWSLSHTGNWLEFKGFANPIAPTTATRTEKRANTAVNEITSRTVDTGTPVTTSFYYNKAGQLVNDGEKIYSYDAWGRLRKVFTIDSGDKDELIEESRYNGLGHRIAYHSDQDFDDDLDGSDPWVDQVYDDSWRIVATFKNGDALTSPRERFIYHSAGMDGRGSSSYIDDVILRERSDSTALSSSAPSTLGDRLYFLQNWRHDMSVLVKSNGETVERIKYTSYGVPRARSAGDFNGDGAVDDPDFVLFQEQYNALLVTYGSPHTAKAGSPLAEVEAWGEYDLNADGVVDEADFTIFVDAYSNIEGVAPGHLSRRSPTSPELNIDNRIGYAGYQWQGPTASWSARSRYFNSLLGNWMSRDRLNYIDGANLFCYTKNAPILLTDPSGLSCNSDAEEDPCEEAKRLGLDKGDAGGVICYKGKKYSCVWVSGGGSTPKPGDPKDDPEARRLIDECIKLHEDRHIRQSGSTSCYNDDPNAMRRVWPPPGMNPNVLECEAYRLESLCLHAAWIKCIGKSCQKYIEKALDHVKKEKAYYCNQ